MTRLNTALHHIAMKPLILYLFTVAILYMSNKSANNVVVVIFSDEINFNIF